MFLTHSTFTLIAYFCCFLFKFFQDKKQTYCKPSIFITENTNPCQKERNRATKVLYVRKICWKSIMKTPKKNFDFFPDYPCPFLDSSRNKSNLFLYSFLFIYLFLLLVFTLMSHEVHKRNVTLCAICYNLHNLKNVKNTLGGVSLLAEACNFTKSKTAPWVLFTIL